MHEQAVLMISMGVPAIICAGAPTGNLPSYGGQHGQAGRQDAA